MSSAGNVDVLVVEDDASIRSTLCEILADAGYKVSVAPNGQQALDLLTISRVGFGDDLA